MIERAESRFNYPRGRWSASGSDRWFVDLHRAGSMIRGGQPYR
jgi:hypothetical protein